MCAEKNPISYGMEYYYFCYWYCSHNTIGAILPGIQGERKILYHSFLSILLSKEQKKWQKSISMKRIAQLILFKCDKHLIRMQSPLPLPPLSPPSSIPLLANFIAWNEKFLLLDLSVNACKHIYILYICLSYRKFNRKKIRVYTENETTPFGSHRHTHKRSAEKVNLCALRDQFLLFRLY